MSPFEHALAEEEKWLCKIPNQPFPSDGLTARRVYIGPCDMPLGGQLKYLNPFTDAILPADDF